MRRELEAGNLIGGRYRLDQFLGQGGMGVVWEATHLGTSERVALKMLHREVPASGDVQRRFLREARVACAIVHPHILPVMEVFQAADGTPVLAMRLLRGETLAEKLSRHEQLTVADAARLLLPVLSALGAAHQLGVVHRDLKPDNIFIERARSGAEHVFVLDFGVAKLTAAEGPAAATAALTRTGAMVGTPRYMAPEQATGNKSADHRVDVWAFGLVLYECLSGAPAIDGSNLASIMKNIAQGGITPIDQVVAGVPSDIARMTMSMLSRRAQDRPADLRPVRDVLSRYAAVSCPDFGPASVSGET